MHQASDSPTMDDLTIIIVSWNCKPYLVDCIRSIDAAGSAYACSVIVVDNNSADGTVEMLQRDFSNVRLLANAHNAGFAAANNQAMNLAQSRYMMLLNPDTILHRGALDELVRFMDGHPTVWVAGPLLLNKGGSVQHSGVRFPSTWNILCEMFFLDRLFPRSKAFGRHKELYADTSIPRSVDYVRGACLIVRASVLNAVGGLDERFFMYFEETDWCYRIAQAGGKVYVCPAAKVVHFGGDEIGHYDERKLVHYHKSLLLFYQKYYTLYNAAVLRFVLALRSLIRIGVWSITGLVRPSLRDVAISSIRGYIKVFGLITGDSSRTRPAS